MALAWPHPQREGRHVSAPYRVPAELLQRRCSIRIHIDHGHSNISTWVLGRRSVVFERPQLTFKRIPWLIVAHERSSRFYQKRQQIVSLLRQVEIVVANRKTAPVASRRSQRSTTNVAEPHSMHETAKNGTRSLSVLCVTAAG